MVKTPDFSKMKDIIGDAKDAVGKAVGSAADVVEVPLRRSVPRSMR